MAKQSILLSLLFSLALATAVHGLPRKQKISRFQLYVEDVLTGPTASTVEVASANSSRSSPTSFGTFVVVDNPVRLTPDTSSEIVGRAQGNCAFVSLEEMTIHVSLDVVFNAGEYNGSSFTVVGNNPFTRPYREIAIGGGSGVFRLARGWIGMTTVYISQDSNMFHYNVTLILENNINILQDSNHLSTDE